MAHIKVDERLPGIRALLAFRPETAGPLGELTDTLLRADNSLSRAEREMIAAQVSYGNACHFCQSSHAAVAAQHLGGTEGDHALVKQVQQDAERAPISEKMKALLAIAALVREDGKLVTAGHVDRARRAGASDAEIHDTVLIAAAFCMFNRYVDGLGTWQPDNPDLYREAGKMLATFGYAAAGRSAG